MSKIEWTDKTWNPVVGCDIVSPGCKNCYAMKQAYRLEHNFKMPGYAGTTKKSAGGQCLWAGKVNCLPERLSEPLRRKKPTRYFVNSMSDLFHPDVPNDFIAAVFGVMAATPQHTYQILTKRPEEMASWFDWITEESGLSDEWSTCHMFALGMDDDKGAIHAKSDEAPGRPWPLPNVWLGVSVENQEHIGRIDYLLDTPAAVRFVSFEPLLSEIVLHKDHLFPRGYDARCAIDWAIVGGESGPHARPLHPDWARSLRDQCNAAGVPFFFKQWGAWTEVGPSYDLPGQPVMTRPGDALVLPDGTVETYDQCGGIGDHAVMRKVGKKAAGRLLDGREWKEYPKGVSRD